MAESNQSTAVTEKAGRAGWGAVRGTVGAAWDAVTDRGLDCLGV